MGQVRDFLHIFPFSLLVQIYKNAIATKLLQNRFHLSPLTVQGSARKKFGNDLTNSCVTAFLDNHSSRAVCLDNEMSRHMGIRKTDDKIWRVLETCILFS